MDHQAFAQLLGNYGEFFGSIAVFATLAYLAIQVRQNNVMQRWQAHIDRNVNLTAPIFQPGSALAAICAKINLADDTLEPLTRELMSRYELDGAQAYAWARWQHQLFMGYEAEFVHFGRSPALDRVLSAVLRFENVRLFFEHEGKWVLAPEFMAYLNSLPGTDLAPGE